MLARLHMRRRSREQAGGLPAPVGRGKGERDRRGSGGKGQRCSARCDGHHQLAGPALFTHLHNNLCATPRESRPYSFWGHPSWSVSACTVLHHVCWTLRGP